MVYLRKTVDEWDIQQLTSEGWEVVNCELTKKDAFRSKREYEANQPGAYKVVKKRVPKDKYLNSETLLSLLDLTSESGIVDGKYGDWVVLATTSFQSTDGREAYVKAAKELTEKAYKAEYTEYIAEIEGILTYYILLNPYATQETIALAEDLIGAEIASKFVYEAKKGSIEPDGLAHLLDSNRGRYLMSGFPDLVISDAWANRSDFRVLKHQYDNEYGDETWANILDNFECKDKDGNAWSLYQDGDLFLYCEALMGEEYRKEFFGE